jgi:DNA repair protein RadA/Sms
MMQMASALSPRIILYITGEESVNQIKMRAERLDAVPSAGLLLLPETNLEVIEALLTRTEPDVVIVDSIQTMYRQELESPAGTVSQVRESTALFMRFAKDRGIPVFLVGHVTKEGVIAGPRVIEHMVDTVLQFEGERAYRVLRSMKNRFGSTHEIGIFEMHDGGLREVHNPSEVFLAERKYGASGSTVVAGMEGTRPILVEVQALVAPTSYGVPQRTATGFDSRRLQMLLAVLEKRVGLHVGQYDVFVNVAGGIRIDEPAADLGMALSIVSSLRDVPVDSDAVVVGEIGLGGEIRSVHQIDRRMSEAKKLGFKKLVLPANNVKSGRLNGTIEIIEVETVDQAIDLLLCKNS